MNAPVTGPSDRRVRERDGGLGRLGHAAAFLSRLGGGTLEQRSGASRRWVHGRGAGRNLTPRRAEGRRREEAAAMDARPTEDQQLLAELAETVAADLAAARDEDGPRRRRVEGPGRHRAGRAAPPRGGRRRRGRRGRGGPGGRGPGPPPLPGPLARLRSWPASCWPASSADGSLLASVADGSRRIAVGLSPELGLEVTDEVIAFDAAGADLAAALTPSGVVGCDLAGATLLDGVDLTRELRATRLDGRTHWARSTPRAGRAPTPSPSPPWPPRWSASWTVPCAPRSTTPGSESSSAGPSGPSRPSRPSPPSST